MYEEEDETFDPGMPPIPPGSYIRDPSATPNRSTSVTIMTIIELTVYVTSQASWR